MIHYTFVSWGGGGGGGVSMGEITALLGVYPCKSTHVQFDHEYTCLLSVPYHAVCCLLSEVRGQHPD